MPIDYSKWNSLELSDDSDVEVHPNIEKGTFIRLRQQKIRQDREARARTIDSLETEIDMNKDLVKRIDALTAEIVQENIESFAKRMLEWSSKAKKQQEVINQVQESIKAGEEIKELSREELIDTLIFRVQEELAATNITSSSPNEIKNKVVEILKSHVEKLKNREPEALSKIEGIKKEQRLHVSVEELSKEGFNKTIINKTKPGSSENKKIVRTSEVLNPEYKNNLEFSLSPEKATSGSKALEEFDQEDENEAETLDLDSDSRKFAMIRSLDQTKDYILQNLSIISSAKSDQILAHAFELEMEGETDLAKQFVRQSLIITYILQMGSSGVGMFFSKISLEGSAGNVMFYTDVDKRYKHIVERCKVLKKEREDNKLESIQLQTDGNSDYVKIYVPDRSNPEEADRVAIFDQLPKDFQDALKVGTLDALNGCLANVTGKRAEEILEMCGKGGFLVVDEEILVENEE
ncbi:hypothetical protein BB561_001816 [Smittium simulii]|uniref:Hsp90 chaperone protein kinase-targeting subunit n=1 Tax=Smittium simulii TaxID=133385 RepID=A0A2T9YSY0_9FUNG|nr:hypothetical protein BB561_001816 [Smittium simulii]